MKDLIIRRDFYVEKLIRRRMNCFVKVAVTEGYDEPHFDSDGIIRVGVLPFLLDEAIMNRF